MQPIQMKNKIHSNTITKNDEKKMSGDIQLATIFEAIRPIPAYSIFLGLCEDGVPLVIDLTDFNSGSFLIAGDDDAVNFKVLSSILTSAYCFNNEREVNIHLISRELNDFSQLLKTPHLNLCLKPHQPETSVAIEELGNLIIHRKSRAESIPYHLLAIDGLDDFLQCTDLETRKSFAWILEYGPEEGIFVFATMESEKIKPIYYQIIEGFPSRILSNVIDPRVDEYLSGAVEANCSELKPGKEVTVISGKTLQIIQIPQ